MYEIPVYLITGFLESGKTSFIKDVLKDENFVMEENNLLICCEEGMEEYDKEKLKKANTTLVMVEDEENLTTEFFKECIKKYEPDKVILEFNGMWDIENLFDTLPEELPIAQMVCTIDSSTYSAYMSNMGVIIVNQFRDADLVIFNRCDENTKKLSLRANVKAVNRAARVLFENKDGQIDDEAELPFNIDADVIEPAEYDFGVLYDDMMNEPKKYDGKTVKIKVKSYNPKNFPEGFQVLGRDAMTCCAEDITPLGLLCRFEDDNKLKLDAWFEITAKVKKEELDDYEDEVPVLYVSEIKDAEKPEDELVYFY